MIDLSVPTGLTGPVQEGESQGDGFPLLVREDCTRRGLCLEVESLVTEEAQIQAEELGKGDVVSDM